MERCVGHVDVVAEAGAVGAIWSVWRRRLVPRIRIQRRQRFVVFLFLPTMSILNSQTNLRNGFEVSGMDYM